MQGMFNFLKKYIDLTEEERQLVIRLNTVRRFLKNDFLPMSSNGELPGYFVLSGCVCAYSTSTVSDEPVIAEFFTDAEPITLPPSSTNGEMYQLRCLEDSEIATGAEVDFEEVVMEFPRFAKVCRVVAEEKMHYFAKFNLKLKQLAPAERYQFLIDERPELIGRIPQYMLAEYLGLSAETLSRVRRRRIESRS